MTSKRSYTNPYKRYCCVYGCLNKKKSRDSKLSFFKIPDDTERRQEWLTAIDREDLLDEKKNKAKNNFVCSEHFEDSSTVTASTSKRLKSDAVPTKLLPHTSHKNIQPDAIKNTSTQALPQTSKDISSQLSKKDNILVSTYNSHTQLQTDIQAQKHTCEIAKPYIDKSLNELKQKSTVPSEYTTSASKSETKDDTGNDENDDDGDDHLSGGGADSGQSVEYDVAPNVEDVEKSLPNRRGGSSFSNLSPEKRLRSQSPKSYTNRLTEFQAEEREMIERRLASLEQSRIETDKELANAINRQATAVEELVALARRFVDVYARNNGVQTSEAEVSTQDRNNTYKIKKEEFHEEKTLT